MDVWPPKLLLLVSRAVLALPTDICLVILVFRRQPCMIHAIHPRSSKTSNYTKVLQDSSCISGAFYLIQFKKDCFLLLGLMTTPSHHRCSQGYIPYPCRLTTSPQHFCATTLLVSSKGCLHLPRSPGRQLLHFMHPSRFRQKDVSTSTLSILAYSSGCRIHHPALWLLCCIIADPGLLAFNCLVSFQKD